ncbi:hypothetical protein ACFE04_014508 [Oxalis oulophora]
MIPHTSSSFGGISDAMNGYVIDRETIFPNTVQYPDFTDGLFNFDDPSLNFDDPFLNSSDLGDMPLLDSTGLIQPLSEITEGGGGAVVGGGYPSPTDESDFSDTLLKYINQMLMEENMEAMPSMFHDPLDLQATENSLFEVIGEQNQCSSLPSAEQALACGDANIWSPSDCCSANNSISSSSSSNNASNLVDIHCKMNLGESRPSVFQMPTPPMYTFQSGSTYHQVAANPLNSFANENFGAFGLGNDDDLALQFQRGVDEANKFLPKSNSLVTDLEKYNSPPTVEDQNAPKVVFNSEYNENESGNLPNRARVRKNHKRGHKDTDKERNHKQSAVYRDECEMSELFDKVLLCPVEENEQPLKNRQNEKTNGNNHGKKQISKKESEIVDLGSMLILCSQAACSGDLRTANELLKQVRQHSSPSGDGDQRLAHYFANALDARLAGTGAQTYMALSAKESSAAEMLKAYHAYISVCPFLRFSVIFANHNIFKLSKNATTLHIVDFGILYGFQWPSLIQSLSKRPGGPPKLRITGIELPQRGFRPAELVQETGRRLAKYCERFNVPFEYNAIAQKWENITIDNLKLTRNEFLAVNCVFRFKNLLDETVLKSSPKNTVLKLIREANPDIFVQTQINGSYGVPFFATRFREAVFHFSALFDICETTMTSDDPMRLVFEKEFHGRDILNIVACEGLERVERPETRKNWQARNTEAGFKQVPLNSDIMKKLRGKVKLDYHNEFMVCEDGKWMLQGWKGRVLLASSAWVPV